MKRSKLILLIVWLVILLRTSGHLHSQVLPQASAELFNVEQYHPTPHPGGYHNAFRTCPSAQISGEMQIDGSGNGFVRDYDCTTRAVTRELLYTSWALNGSAHWEDIHSIRFPVSAQYQNGLLVGITFHSCQGPLTLSLPNGTGDWKVPDYTDCVHNPTALYESGQLKNGRKEGFWYGQNWGTTIKGKVYEVNYIDGALDGVCHWFYGGNPTATATFAHGVANGPFTYIVGDLVVVGENKDGDGTAVLNTYPGNPNGPPAGRAWGTWTFYSKLANQKASRTRHGIPLGENILHDGNGHFKSWQADGTLRVEGDVKNGFQDGDWIEYDYYGRPVQIHTYKDGNILQYTNVLNFPRSESSIVVLTGLSRPHRRLKDMVMSRS